MVQDALRPTGPNAAHQARSDDHRIGAHRRKRISEVVGVAVIVPRLRHRDGPVCIADACRRRLDGSVATVPRGSWSQRAAGTEAADRGRTGLRAPQRPCAGHPDKDVPAHSIGLKIDGRWQFRRYDGDSREIAETAVESRHTSRRDYPDSNITPLQETT